MSDDLKQTKLNAISAKILHRKEKNKFEKLNTVFLVATLVVPLIFIIAQHVTKGTKMESITNTISFVLSLSLMAVSLVSIILKVTDKITAHKIGMRNNIFIASQCDGMDAQPKEERHWFNRYVSEADSYDLEVFAKISAKTRQEVYREALKELESGNTDVKCPVCHSSPWKFKKGDCQLCGNTIKTDPC